MSLVANARAAAVTVALLGSSMFSFAASAVASGSAKPAYDAVYIFGDSYCDVGNIAIATGGTIPAAPYFNNRFSNGPIWVDHLAGAYGLTLKPFLGGGTDYAFGGAEVLAAVPEGNVSIPSVLEQIGVYLALNNGKADPNALYIVEGGGNDILASGGTGNPTTLGGDIAFGLTLGVQLLQSAGAQSFVVPNLIDVGLLPGAKTLGISTFATAASLATNQSLAVLLQIESLSPNIHLYQADTYNLFEAIVADPSHYGFPDITNPCLTPNTSTTPPTYTVCANPYATFFWDAEHPTYFGHSFLAVLAEQAINH